MGLLEIGEQVWHGYTTVSLVGSLLGTKVSQAELRNLTPFLGCTEILVAFLL